MSQPAPPGTGRLIRSGRAAARLLLVWLAATVTLLVLDDLMAGFVLNSRWLALLIALCLGLLYALVWPLIMRVALGFTVITLGLGGFLLSGLLVLAVFVAVPGAQIRGLPTAVLIAGWLTVSTGFVNGLLSIDEDELFFRRAARRMRRRRTGEVRDPLRASSTSRSTGWGTTSCAGRCVTGTSPIWRVGSEPARTGSRCGTPTGALRPVPASRASCMAPMQGSSGSVGRTNPPVDW